MSNIFYTLVFDKGSKLIYELEDTPIAHKWKDLIIANLSSKNPVFPNGWWCHPKYNRENFANIWQRMYLDVCAWNNSEVTRIIALPMDQDPKYQLGDFKKWRFYENIQKTVPFTVPEKFHINMEQEVPPHETPEAQEKLQKTLNHLHERFHEISEEISSYETPNKLQLQNSPLTRLNVDIHTLEHLLGQQNKGDNNDSSNNCCFYMDGSSKWDRQLAPLTQEDRETFNYMPLHGDMIMGYHTVGKNLMHCWQDNDIELVKKGMVRPQLYLATEVICVFQPTPKPRVTRTADFLIEAMWDWVMKNNLSEYVDKNDIAHSANYPPAVAKILNPITMEEINKIYANENLKHVELVDQNTMLKWKSDDYRY